MIEEADAKGLNVEYAVASELVVALEQALAPFKPEQAMNISVTDEGGGKAYGVMIQQAVDPKTGAAIAVLNNVAKGARVVTIRSSGQQAAGLSDLIFGTPTGNRFVMAPCDVRVVAFAFADEDQ